MFSRYEIMKKNLCDVSWMDHGYNGHRTLTTCKLSWRKCVFFYQSADTTYNFEYTDDKTRRMGQSIEMCLFHKTIYFPYDTFTQCKQFGYHSSQPAPAISSISFWVNVCSAIFGTVTDVQFPHSYYSNCLDSFEFYLLFRHYWVVDLLIILI